MDSFIMEVLIDSGLLQYYTHTVFKYQSFNIIVYFKGDKVIIEWMSPKSPLPDPYHLTKRAT